MTATPFDPTTAHPRSYNRAVEDARKRKTVDEAYAVMYQAGYFDAKRNLSQVAPKVVEGKKQAEVSRRTNDTHS